MSVTSKGSRYSHRHNNICFGRTLSSSPKFAAISSVSPTSQIRVQTHRENGRGSPACVIYELLAGAMLVTRFRRPKSLDVIPGVAIHSSHRHTASAKEDRSLLSYGGGITVPAVEPIGTATVDVAAAMVFLKMYTLVAARTGSCAVAMIVCK